MTRAQTEREDFPENNFPGPYSTDNDLYAVSGSESSSFPLVSGKQ
jgi:hypothetical protein